MWLQLIREASLTDVTEAFAAFIFPFLMTWNRWLPVPNCVFPLILPLDFLRPFSRSSLHCFNKRTIFLLILQNGCMFGMEIPSSSFRDYRELRLFTRKDCWICGVCLGQGTRMENVTLKSDYAPWFWGFSTVHRKLVMGLLSGSSSFNYWRICINDMTAQLSRKHTHFSVPLRCPRTRSRTEPLAPRERHYTCTRTPATAPLLSNSCTCSTCKMGKRRMDNQENPQPLISHTIVERQKVSAQS